MVQTSLGCEFYLRLNSHPKRNKLATTKTIPRVGASPDTLGWVCGSEVGVALGSCVANSRVDVGGIGDEVGVGVLLGKTGIGVSVAGGVTRRSNS